MDKYMKPYKSHYACFDCKKTFKRKLIQDINRLNTKQGVDAKCPQCGQIMIHMGNNFAAPKMGSIKEWEYLEILHSVGLTLDSIAIGYQPVPNSIEKLVDYLEEMKFRSQIFLSITSDEQNVITDKSSVKSHFYWSDRIKDIEQKLHKIKKR
jgi:hypothetical protein